MLTDSTDTATHAALDKRQLQALGVLLPIRLHALSFLPGRHPLGRAGEGMRFLRTRPFESGQDNPRDIDKFSPEDEYWVNEWEAEAQASVRIHADMSGSMSFAPKESARNLTLLQLTYSLWRASDRVTVTFAANGDGEAIAERNLKSQLETLAERLASHPVAGRLEPFATLATIAAGRARTWGDLAFFVSDFCAPENGEAAPESPAWRAAIRRTMTDIVPVIVSFELPQEQRGAIKLRDPESGAERLTLLTPSRIERINRREAQRVAELERLFRSLGLDFMTVRREQDVYPGLAELARLRRKRRT